MRLITFFVSLAILLPGMCLASIPATPESFEGNHTIFWSEDWEDGIGLWSASNGVWEVGAPSYGTSEPFGNQCAATNLDGNYPYNTNSRLESVSIDLPELAADDVLWLGLWHWFSNSASRGTDYSSVQIWSATNGWEEISHHFTRTSLDWTPFYIDISEYLGETIKIGFYFNDEQQTGYEDHQGAGWYVDQIRIFDGSFPEPTTISRFDESIDMDWDGWYPTMGVWELGEPETGISEAHSAQRCFGTNLNGNYPYGVWSRLISPKMTLPSSPLDGKLYFSFKQYCSLSGSRGTDYGYVTINDGSGWTDLKRIDWTSNFGSQWTERTFDISQYAGQSVQLGFVIDDNQQSGYEAHTSHGWYIDDLQFSEGDRFVGNPEKFENFGTSWETYVGLWEVGAPTSGPGSAFSGYTCWGTNLQGNYTYGAKDYLYSPLVTLDNTTGLYLKFQHWYSFSGSRGVDYGIVRIKPGGGEWVDISNQFTGSSGGWTQWSFNLDEYSGQTVQFSFKVDDEQQSGYEAHTSSGWYIDDFEIVGMPQREAPIDPFALDVAILAGPSQLNFPHITDNIEKVIIYGSPVEDFIPSLGTRLAVLPPTAMSWTDDAHSGWPATYYRVSIVDDLGNESVPILATHISAVQGLDQTPGAGLVELKGAVPNPFNPTTFINFSLPSTMMVDVEVYDISGRKVADLLHKNLEAGPHKVPFAPQGLASGTYFARVSAGGQVQTKKMALLK